MNLFSKCKDFYCEDSSDGEQERWEKKRKEANWGNQKAKPEAIRLFEIKEGRKKRKELYKDE